MGSSYFRFKQFVVNQENVAMRVNTDGVLLGAWLPLGAADAGRSGTDGISPSAFPSEVLDVGTGTGVIALIMAQRLSAASAVSASSTVSTDSLPGFGNADSRPFSGDLAKRLHITAIDIDKESCMQAEENFAASPWSGILESRHISLQEYVRLCNKMCAAGKFDLIVTNPPYFVNSLKASGERRNGARHNDTLPYRDLAAGVVALLKDSGSFSLILPYAEFGTFEKAANSSYLFVRTRCDVYAREGDAAPKRVMAEFVKGLPSSRTSETLVIQDSNGLTPEYKAITGDFYL